MIKIQFNGAFAWLKGVDETLRHQLVNLLSWKDLHTAYLIKQRNHTWLDPYNCCYDIATDSFATGLIPRVVNLLEELNYDFCYQCDYPYLEPDDVPLPSWAWDHQRETVKHTLQYHRNITEAATGSGKTSSAAFIFSQFPKARCLITVPSVNLLYNNKRTLERILDEPIGEVGDGKCNWQRVTVGIINSLSKHCTGKYQSQLAEQQVFIVDECHGGSSKSYQDLSSVCINTAYRCGLSATAYRNDGADLVLEGVTGPKTLIIPPSVMAELNIIHSPDGYFIEVPDQKLRYTGWQERSYEGKKYEVYTTPNGKPDPDEVYDLSIVHNEYRNLLGLEILQRYLTSKERGGNALIIVQALKHGHILQTLAKEKGIDVLFIDGTVKGKQRMEVLDDFRSGKLDCLIASSILNQGEDLPLLELMINIAGRSNRLINTQRVGRPIRVDKSGKKKKSIIVDFYDLEHHYLINHSKKRMQLMNELFANKARVVSLSELYRVFDEG